MTRWRGKLNGVGWVHVSTYCCETLACSNALWLLYVQIIVRPEVVTWIPLSKVSAMRPENSKMSTGSLKVTSPWCQMYRWTHLFSHSPLIWSSCHHLFVSQETVQLGKLSPINLVTLITCLHMCNRFESKRLWVETLPSHNLVAHCDCSKGKPALTLYLMLQHSMP